MPHKEAHSLLLWESGDDRSWRQDAAATVLRIELQRELGRAYLARCAYWQPGGGGNNGEGVDVLFQRAIMPVYLEFSTRAPPPFYLSTDASRTFRIKFEGLVFFFCFLFVRTRSYSSDRIETERTIRTLVITVRLVERTRSDYELICHKQLVFRIIKESSLIQLTILNFSLYTLNFPESI